MAKLRGCISLTIIHRNQQIQATCSSMFRVSNLSTNLELCRLFLFVFLPLFFAIAGFLRVTYWAFANALSCRRNSMPALFIVPAITRTSTSEQGTPFPVSIRPKFRPRMVTTIFSPVARRIGETKRKVKGLKKRGIFYNLQVH